MFQITILFLYLIAAAAFAWSRLQPEAGHAHSLELIARISCAIGIALHAVVLYQAVTGSGAITLSLASAVSLIGLQLAVIAFVAAYYATLQGVSAGLLVLAAPTALGSLAGNAGDTGTGLTWQMQTHVFTSMFAYGLLTAGAIVAIYSLIQDRRLSSGQLTTVNRLFAPLETTEGLLYGVTTAGFAVLALSVISGMTFVENLFAQHLVHKTVLSLLALVLFGVLLAGRHFAGWRGKRAVYIYLGGFGLLCLAYFGSRFILEELLDRSWG